MLACVVVNASYKVKQRAGARKATEEVQMPVSILNTCSVASSLEMYKREIGIIIIIIITSMPHPGA